MKCDRCRGKGWIEDKEQMKIGTGVWHQTPYHIICPKCYGKGEVM